MKTGKKTMPLNLQFFAEKTGQEPDVGQPTEPSGQEPDVGQPTEPSGQEPDVGQPTEPSGQEPDGKEPSVQELLVRISKLERAKDKATSEAATYKKKYNEKLSEKEKIDLEKAEREAEREQQFQELMRENRINKLEKNYLALGYKEDEASKMAIAEVDGEEETKIKIMRAVDERKKREYEAEWMKTRPPVNAGTGDKQLTKERFDSMSMAEKSNLYRENKAEYDRLNGMK